MFPRPDNGPCKQSLYLELKLRHYQPQVQLGQNMEFADLVPTQAKTYFSAHPYHSDRVTPLGPMNSAPSLSPQHLSFLKQLSSQC
ncbi:hypothetical protein A0O36_01106 [Piscirickettsiaceae bacterium NZ-RLO1]|nr:hypothetical protein A0O36_01106 [Piscirickettsiaceae bacterium NZ-RLO1]